MSQLFVCPCCGGRGFHVSYDAGVRKDACLGCGHVVDPAVVAQWEAVVECRRVARFAGASR